MILSGNKAIAKDYIEGLKMLSNMRLCSNVPAQSVVQTALGGHQSVNDYIVPGGRIYEQREYVYKAFCDIPGITAVKPKAAFYMFPKIDTKKFNITNDEKFALDLLRDTTQSHDRCSATFREDGKIEMSKETSFSAGDFVVYPAHGVGKTIVTRVVVISIV